MNKIILDTNYIINKYISGFSTKEIALELNCSKSTIQSILKENNISLNIYNKHNLSKTKLYKIWRGMKSRCNDKNHSKYKYYGEGGIKVCKEWADNFLIFYNWAMKNGYEEGLTIDRIDNDGNYFILNCRWCSAKKQANNKSNNHIILFNNKSQTLMEWSEELKIKYSTLKQRILRGWTIERAFSKK